MLHYCNETYLPEELQDNTIIDNTWLVEVREYNFNTQIFQVHFLKIKLIIGHKDMFITARILYPGSTGNKPGSEVL